MNTDQIVAVFGGVAVAVVVRVSNIVVTWLAHVLRVEPPDPIPVPDDTPST